MTRKTARRLIVASIAALIAFSTTTPVFAVDNGVVHNGSVHNYGEMVDYDLTFPVAGPNHYTDGFWASRANGIHHAQDIMADKMVPIVAAHDGVISKFNGSGNQAWIDLYGICCSIHIRHDDGWESVYIHMNNDTPGTDDGKGWGIAPGIALGVHVKAGQLIGWVGDSGNAENTDPHLHFELFDPEGIPVNSYNSLRAAEGKGTVSVCQAPSPVTVDALVGGTGLLKDGATGLEVKQLQKFLSTIGYPTGPIDGALGPLTSAAIRAFQKGRGLTADGVVGPVTRGEIRIVAKALPAMSVLDPNGRIIRPGYTGDDVKNLQQLLALAGFDPGPADGVYGPKTEAAIAAFQTDYGKLTVDGKLGPNTRRALADALGLSGYEVCG